jgi:hypothetical protein
MVYKQPEKKEDKLKEVFDKKTGKNVFITVKKLLEDEGRYVGISGKIKNMQARLREISGDTKFTDADREEINKQIKKITDKVAGKAKDGVRSPHKKFKGGLMVKPKAAKRGY